MRRRTSARIALLIVTLGVIAAFGAPVASKSEDAADVVAAQIRLQGHRCDKPVRAARDLENSRPDAAAWLLECRNAAYRVQLIPHMAARVELIEPAGPPP
jgi:hypothetical protein